MRYLAAFLSMPNVGSWNRKWSGENRPYVSLFRAPERNKQFLAERLSLIGYYTYDFGDGWSAGITIKEVDEKEYKQLKKSTAGFYGYDWMVNSIIRYKRIVNDQERSFIEFHKSLIDAGFNDAAINTHSFYDELTFTTESHNCSIRYYNQYNKHADEHMRLYIDGKDYCELSDHIYNHKKLIENLILVYGDHSSHIEP